MSISRWWCRAVLGTREAGGPGSSEDDPPGPANHTRDRGDGRGLNPSPDERGPAVAEYDDYEVARARRIASRSAFATGPIPSAVGELDETSQATVRRRLRQGRPAAPRELRDRQRRI